MSKTVKSPVRQTLQPGKSITGKFCYLREGDPGWWTLVLDVPGMGPTSIYAGKHLLELLRSNREAMERGRPLTITLLEQLEVGKDRKMNAYELTIHDRDERPSQSGPDGTVFGPDGKVLLN
jgi:hypothetical protein